MNHRVLKSTVLASLIGLTTAGAAHAAERTSESELLDACIQHYIAGTLASYQGKVSVVKDSTAGFQPMIGAHHLQVQVSAVHRGTGTRLGTMTCTIDSAGNVLSTKGTSINAAKLAATLAKSPALAKNE